MLRPSQKVSGAGQCGPKRVLTREEKGKGDAVGHVRARVWWLAMGAWPRRLYGFWPWRLDEEEERLRAKPTTMGTTMVAMVQRCGAEGPARAEELVHARAHTREAMGHGRAFAGSGWRWKRTGAGASLR